MRLDEKVVIVTGGSSGIGATAATLFAAEGAKVVLGARRRDLLEETRDAIRLSGGDAVALAGDVRDGAFARSLVELAHDEYGGLDAAFNNAGILGSLGPIPAMEDAEWREVLDINLTGAFLAAKYQTPALVARGGGSLIFMSTFVGHTVGIPGLGAYAASKSGLIGLTQVLAAEHGPQRVRVNALLPGATRTAMLGEFAADDESVAHVEDFHALKRLAEPVEIARAALFLVSDESSFVTGTAMIVDGGNSINKT